MLLRLYEKSPKSCTKSLQTWGNCFLSPIKGSNLYMLAALFESVTNSVYTAGYFQVWGLYLLTLLQYSSVRSTDCAKLHGQWLDALGCALFAVYCQMK